ncbi:MAG: serine/threonine-protein kinase, partial [Deltaproteobacteria bacterium]
MSEVRGVAAPTDTAPGHNVAGNALPALTPHSQTVGRYTIRFRVASGGMASVYLAIFRAGSRFEKWVALKVVHPHLAAERGFIEMFLDEARIVSRLNHSNVCTVFDSGESSGQYYLAMEYLHGATLADLVREAVVKDRMNVDVMARVIADCARGLHAAHELRDSTGRPLELIHRDVSPQNIFVLADGVAKVLDFGIAVSRDRLGPETEAGQVKGKLAYMAPEQLTQKTV